MNLIILGLMLVSNCMADSLLESLYGVHGGNRVRVCVSAQEERACDGAVWMQTWVVVREACIGEALTAPISVWKQESNCSEAMAGHTKSLSHNVVQRYFQQPHPTDDVALLRLDWPFFLTDPLDNQTVDSDIVNKLVLWVGNINEHTTESPFTRSPQVRHYNRRYMDMYSSPIKMFLATVVLPSTTFMLFFFFVIFCTGSSKRKIPYKTLTNETPESAHV